MLSRVMLSLRPATPRLVNSARTFFWNRDPFTDMRSMIREMEHQASQMERQMERLLGSGSLGHKLPSLLPGFSRRVPVIQSGKQQQGGDNFHVALDLSEFKPENIKVTLKNRTLSIEAREEQSQEGYFSAKETSHQYTIPEDVDVNNLVSTLEANGYLSIEAPRAKAEPKQIPIHKEGEAGQTLLKDETSKQAAA